MHGEMSTEDHKLVVAMVVDATYESDWRWSVY